MRAETSKEPETWQDPTVNPPPRGCKLHILTAGMVAVHGEWREGHGYVAWARLPRVPQALKDKLTGARHDSLNINNNTGRL